MKPRTVHEAVDQLIQRQRNRIPHDNGTWTWKTTPSLWEMLTVSTGHTGGSGGATSSNARLPISATAIDLTQTITAATTEAAINLAKTSRHTVPGNLRAIAANLTDDDDAAEWWTEQTITWAQQIRACLHLNAPRIRWVRDLPCPACGAKHATGNDGVEATQVPALNVTWTEPEGNEYHSDDETKLRAIECAICATTWWGTTGAMMLGQMVQANLNHETLTDAAT